MRKDGSIPVRADSRSLWHPCSQMKDHELHPPVRILSGRGAMLHAENGARLIDGISSWWVNLFGHSHPRLNRALQKQAERLEHVLFAGFTHDPAIRYARELLSVAPRGLSRVFFADNGSSAVEAAMKMSFQYALQTGGRARTFLALEGGYHGETLGALAAGGIGLYRKIFAPLLADVRLARAPSCGLCPFGKTRQECGAECFSFLEKKAASVGTDNLCGVFIEPLVQCANRMNMYPPVYLKKLRDFCTARKIHFIADEIAVGFGRTGRLFACGHAGVTPDIMCLSKGITGGYMPFSVVLATEEIYRAFYDDYSKGKAFLHSHSYSGNPLGCALALEVLKIFREEGILKRMKPRMRQMAGGLKELSQSPRVANTRRTGLIGAFDIVNPRTGKPFPPERRTGFHACRRAVEMGALLRPLGDTIYFMPPLTISEGELDGLFEITEKAIKLTLL